MISDDSAFVHLFNPLDLGLIEFLQSERHGEAPVSRSGVFDFYWTVHLLEHAGHLAALWSIPFPAITCGALKCRYASIRLEHSIS